MARPHCRVCGEGGHVAARCKKNTGWSAPDRAALDELLRIGVSDREITQRLHIHRTIVWTRRKELERGGGSPDWAALDKALRTRTDAAAVIGARLGVDPRVVAARRRYLVQQGLAPQAGTLSLCVVCRKSFAQKPHQVPALTCGWACSDLRRRALDAARKAPGAGPLDPSMWSQLDEWRRTWAARRAEREQQRAEARQRRQEARAARLLRAEQCAEAQAQQRAERARQREDLRRQRDEARAAEMAEHRRQREEIRRHRKEQRAEARRQQERSKARELIVRQQGNFLHEDLAQEQALAALEGRTFDRRVFFQRHAPYQERPRIPEWTV